MENTWYENTMLFNSRGQYDPSGDDYDEPYETTFVKCGTCGYYLHPKYGVIDQRINEFFCNECEKQYQENHKND